MASPKVSEGDLFGCNKCGILTNGVLVLVCGHNLCLACAQKNLKGSISKPASDGQAKSCVLTEIDGDLRAVWDSDDRERSHKRRDRSKQRAFLAAE
jgi:hypothetical protein